MDNKHPRRGINMSWFIKNDSVDNFAKKMLGVREEMGSALEVAVNKLKRFYNRKKGLAKQYSKGDRVWPEATNIRMDHPMKKLNDKQYVPFEIKVKVMAAAYELKLPKTWRPIHPVFNEFL